jgi:hypothetical protein
VTYDFGLTPEPPAAPPAVDSAELDELIESEDIDVESDTDQFLPTGAANTDLNAIDPTLPVSGEYEDWPEPADAFVDVYSYSTAVFVGTFQIVNGDVVLTGMDLSHLTPGVHRLLLRGQTSGAIAVVQLTVLAAPIAAHPATGPADVAPLAAGAFIVVLLGAVGLLAVRRSRA